MKTRWAYFTLPAGLSLLLLVVFPQIVILEQSLRPGGGLGIIGSGWTVANYARIFADSYNLMAFLRTFWIAALVTAICLVAGYPVAYFVARSTSRHRALLIVLIVAPLLITVVIRSLGWMVLLADNGPVNRALIALRLTRGPLHLLYNDTGVVLGMVHAVLPYMILPLIVGIQDVSRRLEEAAANMGASRWQIFTRVVLPLTLPSITGASLLVFSTSASAYTVTVMLGGGRVATMPVLVAQELLQRLDYPLGAAFSIVLMVSSLLLAFATLHAGGSKGSGGPVEV